MSVACVDMLTTDKRSLTESGRGKQVGELIQLGAQSCRGLVGLPQVLLEPLMARR